MSFSEVHSRQICAVSDDRAGNARQAEALAAALAARGHDDPGRARVAVEAAANHVASDLRTQDRDTLGDIAFDRLRLRPRPPWRWWAPHRSPDSEAAFGAGFRALLQAPPALAVGCGRQAALATRLLRERGTRVVQILDPRLDPRHWDVLVVPEHDAAADPRLHASNTVIALGSLHPVDDAWLAAARERFARFAALPRPITAVLLGGSSRHARFDRMSFEVLAAKLEAALAREGGSVLVTASRRSDPLLRKVLAHRYDDTPGLVWRGPEDGENPYPGLLAWADRIVCSPDSVNMISEACATLAPVFVFDPARVRGRPRRFLDTLLGRGRIRAMDERLAAFAVEPLRETARVAEEVGRRLGMRSNAGDVRNLNTVDPPR